MATAIEVEPRGAKAEASKTPTSSRNVRFSGNKEYPGLGKISINEESKDSAAQVTVSKEDASIFGSLAGHI